MVMLRHAGNVYSMYGHLAAVAVREGDAVASGDRIGTQGSTGMSTAEHLHFEIRVPPIIPPSPAWKTPTDRLMEHAAQMYVWRARKELLR
jgi:murein DD-endopeptidase MepM/ murein hydrolase activator NlpD